MIQVNNDFVYKVLNLRRDSCFTYFRSKRWEERFALGITLKFSIAREEARALKGFLAFGTLGLGPSTVQQGLGTLALFLKGCTAQLFSSWGDGLYYTLVNTPIRHLASV